MANNQMGISIIDHSLPCESHNTYDVVFFGVSVYTFVTHDPDVVTQWIADVESIHRRRLHHLVVGLDVEWRPSSNRHISNPAATLQLCVGRRCLVYQLIHSPSIPKSLVDFLANPNYTFVGIGVDQDLEKIQEDYEFGFNTNTVDLRGLAAERYGLTELRRAGLKTLASFVLEKNFEKPKRVTMSRWDCQWLTPVQVQYACVDAFVSFEVGNVQPYKFILPPSWKQMRVANILSGNYCQPKCAEPWVEVKFEDENQGKIQVVASPLIRLTNKPNAKIEDIGSPEKVIASLGPFVTGNTFDPDELQETSIEKQGDQTYYKYVLETPYALTGTHNLAKATAKGSTVVLFVASASDKQWQTSEKTLQAILDSFEV